MTLDLQKQLRAAKGRGTRKGKTKATPRVWNDKTGHEKWWLFELWAGRLRTAVDEAEAKCHRVQARPFVMGEQDV